MAASDCELVVEGFWSQPINAATSVAFIIVGLLILARRSASLAIVTYALLAVGNGVGSVIYHGPGPPWGEFVHDAPLVGILVFVTADAVSDLLRRPISPLWWLGGTAAALALSEVGPELRLGVQASVTVVAISAIAARYWRRPQTRRTIVTAGLLLGTGALIGTLSRTGMPLCDPDSLLQGHAVWHVLAALAILRFAPVVDKRYEEEPQAGGVAGGGGV